MYSSIIFLLFGLFLGSSLLSQASGLEESVPFEKRLSVQLTNSSNNLNNSNFSNFANDATLLDQPRNSTMEQIKSNNQTVNQLFNNSIQTYGRRIRKNSTEYKRNTFIIKVNLFSDFSMILIGLTSHNLFMHSK